MLGSVGLGFGALGFRVLGSRAEGMRFGVYRVSGWLWLWGLVWWFPGVRGGDSSTSNPWIGESPG